MPALIAARCKNYWNPIAIDAAVRQYVKTAIKILEHSKDYLWRVTFRVVGHSNTQIGTNETKANPNPNPILSGPNYMTLSSDRLTVLFKAPYKDRPNDSYNAFQWGQLNYIVADYYNKLLSYCCAKCGQ